MRDVNLMIMICEHIKFQFIKLSLKDFLIKKVVFFNQLN